MADHCEPCPTLFPTSVLSAAPSMVLSNLSSAFPTATPTVSQTLTQSMSDPSSIVPSMTPTLANDVAVPQTARSETSSAPSVSFFTEAHPGLNEQTFSLTEARTEVIISIELTMSELEVVDRARLVQDIVIRTTPAPGTEGQMLLYRKRQSKQASPRLNASAVFPDSIASAGDSTRRRQLECQSVQLEALETADGLGLTWTVNDEPRSSAAFSVWCRIDFQGPFTCVDEGGFIGQGSCARYTATKLKVNSSAWMVSCRSQSCSYECIVLASNDDDVKFNSCSSTVVSLHVRNGQLTVVQSSSNMVKTVTGCIVGSTLEPSQEICDTPFLFSDWECVMTDLGKCRQFLPEEGGDVLLVHENRQPCNHQDTYVYKVRGCRDAACATGYETGQVGAFFVEGVMRKWLIGRSLILSMNIR